MPRAVLDPNVLISAFITPRGATAQLLVALLDGEFEMIGSPRLIEEVDGVLRREKFRRYATLPEIDTYVSRIRELAVVIEDPAPSGERLSEDPGDEYLIDLARTARVDALVSGDRHLLKLRALIPVMTPADFLERLRR